MFCACDCTRAFLKDLTKIYNFCYNRKKCHYYTREKPAQSIHSCLIGYALDKLLTSTFLVD